MLFGFAPWIVYWVLVGNVPFAAAALVALAISIDIALIGVVGGIGTLWGPAVGALVYVVLAKGVALKFGGLTAPVSAANLIYAEK